MFVQSHLSAGQFRKARTLGSAHVGPQKMDVVRVETVEEAERLCDFPVKNVGAIVLDLSGRAEMEVHACRQMRGAYDCPILVLTSDRDEDHQVRVYLAGADECIVRPISDNLLMAKVDRWVLQAQ